MYVCDVDDQKIDVSPDLESVGGRPHPKSPPEDSTPEYGPGSELVSGGACCCSPTLLSLQTLLLHVLTGSDFGFAVETNKQTHTTVQ